LVEQRTFNPQVQGSSPWRPTAGSDDSGYLFWRYLPMGNLFTWYLCDTEVMFISLLIVVGIALVGHVVVSTAVDSYNGYGDNGPDFRL